MTMHGRLLALLRYCYGILGHGVRLDISTRNGTWFLKLQLFLRLHSLLDADSLAFIFPIISCTNTRAQIYLSLPLALSTHIG